LQHKKEIDTGINLDGLIAQEEQTVSFDVSPFIRVRHKFDIPSLQSKRGLFVIELIGNGISSRALIRKGTLQYVEHLSTAGQVFYVINDQKQIVC
jgi:hypothetical protein